MLAPRNWGVRVHAARRLKLVGAGAGIVRIWAIEAMVGLLDAADEKGHK